MAGINEGKSHGPAILFMTDSTSPTDNSKPSCAHDGSKFDLKLSVTLAADRDAVDPVVRSVMEVVRDTKCAFGREDDIELALTEALANAVVHGARNDPSKIVECDVACDQHQGMLIVVRDPDLDSTRPMFPILVRARTFIPIMVEGFS